MSSILSYSDGDFSGAPLPFTREAGIERDLRRDVKLANADVVRKIVQADAARVVGGAIIEASVALEVRNVEGLKVVGRAYESAAAGAGPITQLLLSEMIPESSQHLRNAVNQAHRGVLRD